MGVIKESCDPALEFLGHHMFESICFEMYLIPRKIQYLDEKGFNQTVATYDLECYFFPLRRQIDTSMAVIFHEPCRR